MIMKGCFDITLQYSMNKNYDELLNEGNPYFSTHMTVILWQLCCFLSNNNVGVPS